MDTLFFIGVFLAFFLQFLLLSKKHKTLSDKILAIWMFFIGFHLFSYSIYYLEYWDKYPHLVGIHHWVPLLHGPLLYLYTVFSLRKDQHIRQKDYMHFAPSVLVFLYMFRFYFFYSTERKIMINNGEVDDFSLFMTLSLIAFLLSGIIYPILSYRLLGKHRRLIDENFSYDEEINLNWLKYCIWGIGLIFITATIVTLMREIIGVDFGFNADLIFYTEITFFIFFLGYFGIRHKGIFAENTAKSNQIVEPKTQGEYKKSGLDQTVAVSYHDDLLKIMKEQKPFLEPKLSLGNLAKRMNISVNHLSQIINQYEGINFYDFVNKYRVDEFMLKVADTKNRNFSILAIALDSGFNSKSSFNQVFKKCTGKTPSQYMTEIKA